MEAAQFKFLFTNVVNLIFLFSIFFSLIMLITRKNPVTAIIYLIFFFINISLLLIFYGADYFGVLFLMIYAGAISIILLFVVMFLDMKELLVKKEKYSNFLLFLLFFLFLVVVYKFTSLALSEYCYFLEYPIYVDWAKVLNFKTSIEVIGVALYNFYIFQFLVIGLLLFLAMIFVISLILNLNYISKRQEVMSQLKAKNNIKISK